MRIMVSYDNTLVPYTTGNYFLTAFSQVADAAHVLPWELNKVNPRDFDLFVKIDDGISSNKWRADLHPSAYYVIDSHIDTEGWRMPMIQNGDFDYVFVAQKNAMQGYSNICNAYWVPLGCDPAMHSPRLRVKEKKFDTCFIGNLHSEYAGGRIDYLDRLFKEAPNFFYGMRTWQDMADKYFETRVVFNHALNNDINMRYFEACCSGSFQLASRIHDNGFEELFGEGEHMECYDNEDEMVEKLHYYLKHEKEREKIAKSGMEMVRAFHTYRDRAEKIVKIIEKATTVQV